MAFTTDRSNIRGDLWACSIGGTAIPYAASLEINIGGVFHEVKAAQTGDDILATLLMGRVGGVRITFIQCTAEELKGMLGITGTPGADNPAVGAMLAQNAVTLHDPLAGDNAGDILFHAMSWRGLTTTTDGQGEKQAVAELVAERSASNGKVWTIGQA